MKVIYTAIFGNYEEMKDPTVITPDWKYICYTDQPLKSDVWDVLQMETGAVGGSIRAARLSKIMCPIPLVDSIWIDGSLQITCDLNEFWENHFVSPFTVVQHPIRNCVYSEGAACIGNKRGNDKDIREQVRQYKSEGLPVNNGLIQSGILLRENTKEVREFCELWWEQIKLSTRDQIGFAYTEWKLNKLWPRIKMDYRLNPYFKFTTHYSRRKKIA